MSCYHYSPLSCYAVPFGSHVGDPQIITSSASIKVMLHKPKLYTAGLEEPVTGTCRKFLRERGKLKKEAPIS